MAQWCRLAVVWAVLEALEALVVLEVLVVSAALAGPFEAAGALARASLLNTRRTSAQRQEQAGSIVRSWWFSFLRSKCAISNRR